MTILIRVYLIDVVLKVDDSSTEDRLLVPGSRKFTALALALAWILPNFVLLFVDGCKMGPLEMKQSIRTHHRVNFFRKYLNYAERSRKEVPIQSLTGTMNSDIP